MKANNHNEEEENKKMLGSKKVVTQIVEKDRDEKSKSQKIFTNFFSISNHTHIFFGRIII